MLLLLLCLFSKLHKDFVAVLEGKYSFECAEELWDDFLPKIGRQSVLESRNSPGIKTLPGIQAAELDIDFGEGKIGMLLLVESIIQMFMSVAADFAPKSVLSTHALELLQCLLIPRSKLKILHKHSVCMTISIGISTGLCVCVCVYVCKREEHSYAGLCRSGMFIGKC